ncbi:WD40 repeat domain-containing protein [Micromonospora sp. LH3U1]|uniref:WD40 repeat domain-containing protein n=1 Tax=Micromonospora sp. LH3U1 TaxID=3018339 RepID=UPI0023493E9F|nr:WD40 repeat domain-containing protein [Micromonospora sp. LH3U1]WCN81773.1 WD40 repeat domain-containing protein [Micromonospora sp. LH3U1]
MAALSRAPDVTGGLKQLNHELHRLHARAGYPSVRDMARACDCGPNLVKKVFSAPQIPNLPRLLKIVEFLAKLDRKADPDAQCDHFDSLWQAAMAEQVPDLFPPSITDSDDDDGFGPPAAGARPSPPGPVGPTGGGVSTPPTAGEPAASFSDDGAVHDSIPDAPQDEWRALFVGVDSYLTTDATQVVHRDLTPARQLADIFHDSGDGPSSATNELLLNPTRARLWSSFVEAASQTRETLVIYYTGHGIRDARTSEVYLTAADTTTTADGFTVDAISVRDFRYLLALSPVKQLVLIVDVCFDNSSERRTTVLPTRPFPEEPYNVRSDSSQRRTFVLANSAEAGPNLSAFSSGLVQVLAATGSGKTMAFLHAQLAARAEAQHWHALRRAHLNDGDQIRLDGLLRDRGPARHSVWHVDDRLKLTHTAAPPVAASVNDLAVVNRTGQGIFVASEGAYRTIRLWNQRDDSSTSDSGAAAGVPTRRVEALTLAAVADGRIVMLTTGSDGTLEWWRWGPGNRIAAMPSANTSPVTAIAAAVLPDRRAVLCAISDSKTILSWAMDEGASQRPGRLQLDDHVSSMAVVFTPKERASVIIGHSTGRLVVRDLESGHLLATLDTGQRGAVKAVAAGLTPDGRTMVATADETGTVRFWDLENHAAIGEPIRHASDKVILTGISDAGGVLFAVDTR